MSARSDAAMPRAGAAGRAPRLGRMAQVRDRVAAAWGRMAATALLEIRLNLLSPTPWIIGAILGAFGILNVLTAPDKSSLPLAWGLSHDTGPLSGVLFLFLAASLANRPLRYDVTELLDSKVAASEELIFGRWVGMVAAVLAALGVEYGATMLMQELYAEPPVLPLAYFQSVVSLLPPVLFLSTLAFCLVTVTRILVLGAGLAALGWVVLYGGPLYYPSVLRIELSQNAPVFLGLTATVLLAMLLGYQGRRREKRSPVAYGLGFLTGLVFLATVIHASWIALALPSKASAATSWERLREYRYEPGKTVPNFAWTNLNNRRTSIAGLRGKHALLVFVQPKDGGLAALLRRLATLRRELLPEGLEVLCIFLSEDLHAARDAAALARADLPVVTDWGAPATGPFNPDQPASVISWKLRVPATPAALLLDAEGKEVTRELPLDEDGVEDLKVRLRAALAGEPLPPADPAAGLQGAVR